MCLIKPWEIKQSIELEETIISCTHKNTECKAKQKFIIVSLLNTSTLVYCVIVGINVKLNL